MWITRHLVSFLPRLVVASVIVFALTATYIRNAPLPWAWMETVRSEARGACDHPDVQWMTVALVALYFFGFAALRWLQVRSQPSKVRVRTRLVLVVVFSGWALASYALNYDTAVRSTDLLVLLTALAAGQGVAFWLGWEGSAGRSTDWFRPDLLCVLAVLLALAGLAHPAASREFQYRGQTRWVGLWENPNIFGVLMALGVVLAAGLLLLHRVGGIRASPSFPPSGEKGRGEGERVPGVALPVFRSRVPPWLSPAIWLACLASCATGLLFSYSRGAWLGAALGLGWLGWSILRSATEPPPPPCPRLLLLRRCAPGLLLLALSLGVIAFWSLRHTEIPLLRRVFTVGNPNDFSWRNRVATWPGAIEVMARKPATGWGWNRPAAVYEYGHQPVWLSEGAAITLNDYLMLGMTLGGLVFWAFLLWVWLAWHTATLTVTQTPNFQLPICLLQAALLPLLLGFALDGGLFKLAVAVPFCVLMELAVPGYPRRTPHLAEHTELFR